MRVEHTDLYRPRANGNVHEDEHGTIRSGDGVRVPLMLTDGTPAMATLAERRAFNVPAEMSDAAAADFIAGYKVATSAVAQFDGSLHRPGYRYSYMIQAASQVRDGVSLADAERARDAAFQEKIRRDANAWRRPERQLHLPTSTADASAQVTDVRSPLARGRPQSAGTRHGMRETSGTAMHGGNPLVPCPWCGISAPRNRPAERRNAIAAKKLKTLPSRRYALEPTPPGESAMNVIAMLGAARHRLISRTSRTPRRLAECRRSDRQGGKRPRTCAIATVGGRGA